jgi:hypothetical protein
MSDREVKLPKGWLAKDLAKADERLKQEHVFWFGLQWQPKHSKE